MENYVHRSPRVGCRRSANLRIGITFNNVASLTVSNFVCNQLAWCVIPYGNETLNNVQCVSDILNNICFSSGSDTGNTMTFNNVSACVSHQPYPKGIIYAGNATLNLTGYVGYIKSPSTSPNHIADNGTGNLALTVNNSIFDSNVSGATPYHLTGTGNTFSGGETGFGNAYVLPDVYNLIFNNTVYTIPNWKAAVTPQDSAAVTTGSGLSACTLP